MTHTEACIAINLIPRLGPVRLRRLLEVFGKPQAILREPAGSLAKVEGIGPEIARGIADWQNDVDLPAELARIKVAGVHVLTAQDDAYPANLRTIYDPPVVLYVWGELTHADVRAVGVVGSRRTTFYGTETAKKLSYELASAGLTIVSGLARGIDTAAHEGAIAAHGRTVAVLGCGLSEIYPPENFPLAERIVAGHGAVVSEYPMLTRPDRQTFPMRNRIISGCSLGVLVVEAGLKSGALISANQALEQGRSVFAVPGPIDRPSSQGSNRLIQQGGAKLVMESADIIEELNSLPDLFTAPSASVPTPPASSKSAAKLAKPIPQSSISSPPPSNLGSRPNLSSTESTILAAVERDETPIDRVISNCGLPTPTVASTLLALELKKLIKQLPGKMYVRLV